MIRFGSRLDVYLPEGSVVAVSRGQRAIAGETMLACLPGADSDAALPDAARLRWTASFRRSIRKRERGRPRRRLVPFTAVLPNLVTLLGLCAGLTAIRMAVEHRFDIAVAAIIFAVILDGIDGRLARYFRATSQFGEQLDSLADFVNFGVAPAHLPLCLAARRALLLRLDLRARPRDLHRAAARPLQRGARLATSRGRTGTAISSSAFRRRRARSSCCCRSSWSGSAASTCPHRRDRRRALRARHRAPDGEPPSDAFGQAVRPAHPARHGAAGARRRRAPRRAPRQLSVLVPGGRRASPISRTCPLPGARWNRAGGAIRAPAEATADA